MNHKRTSTTLTPRQARLQAAVLTVAWFLVMVSLLAIPALRSIAGAGFAALFVTVGIRSAMAARSATARRGGADALRQARSASARGRAAV